MDTLTLTLGERILLCRHRARLSKTELAHRTGVSPSAISKYEDDISAPSQETITNLAIALGVSVNFLLYGFYDSASEMERKGLLKKKEDFTL